MVVALNAQLRILELSDVPVDLFVSFRMVIKWMMSVNHLVENNSSVEEVDFGAPNCSAFQLLRPLFETKHFNIKVEKLTIVLITMYVGVPHCPIMQRFKSREIPKSPRIAL